jgi:hypothetical protein
MTDMSGFFPDIWQPFFYIPEDACISPAPLDDGGERCDPSGTEGSSSVQFHLPSGIVSEDLHASENSFYLNDGMLDLVPSHGIGVVYPPGYFCVDTLAVNGTPAADAAHWQLQQLPDSCAIMCQKYILQSFIPECQLTELELATWAYDEGYYHPGAGTMIDDVGRILEHHGIAVERSQGNSVSDIIEHLSHNRKLIVGLDSNEIWQNSWEQQLKDLFFMPEANHAVQIIGYDEEREVFILNDPGRPDGKAFEVSYMDFELAWDDSNRFLMVTKNAPAVA